MAITFRKQRKAVSPVVATLMIITLVIAGGSIVAFVLRQSVDDAPTVDEDSISTLDVVAETSIIKLGRLPNNTYYSSIDVQVNYKGPLSEVYVYDVDIVVDGVRLDEFAEWVIIDSDAERTTDGQGKFTGFKQLANTTATYKVNLTDSSVQLARLDLSKGFNYEISFGLTQGSVDGELAGEHIAVNIYRPVVYNVSIIHYDQKLTDKKAPLYELYNAIVDVNGTNNVFLLLDTTRDIYNSKKTTINGTYMGEYYDLVINAEWVANTNVASELLKIYQSGTPMFFFGKADKIWKDNIVDNATTHAITSNWFTPVDKGRSNFLGGFYQWASSPDYIVQSLSGTIPLSDELNYLKSIGTLDTSNLTKEYGYVFYEAKRVIIRGLLEQVEYSGNGALLTLKEGHDAINGGNSSVVALPIDHRLLATADMRLVIRNAILTLLFELERLGSQAVLSIDSIQMTNIDTSNWRRTKFNLEITLQALDGELPFAGMQMDFKLAKFKFRGDPYTLNLKVGNQAPVTSTIDLNGRSLKLNIGSLLSGNLKQGERLVIEVVQVQANSFSFSCKDWKLTMDYTRLDLTPLQATKKIAMGIPNFIVTDPYC